MGRTVPQNDRAKSDAAMAPTCVSRRDVDDDVAGLQPSLSLSLLDHVQRNAVLQRPAGIMLLELAQDGGCQQENGCETCSLRVAMSRVSARCQPPTLPGQWGNPPLDLDQRRVSDGAEIRRVFATFGGA
eukprot:6868680-Prymnesium_polylepis.1